MYKAKFRTAYDQREIVMDVAVIGSSDLVVGQLVTLTEASGSVPAYISSAQSVSAATHIVAQSDMTMEYGHVPVENRDYRYSDVVADSTTKKHVALFKVISPDDIILTPSAEGNYGA